MKNRKPAEIQVAIKFLKRNHKDSVTKFPGFEDMFTKLLENGTIICPSESTEIVLGGIGNFIDCSIAKDAINCYRWNLNPSFWVWVEFKNFLNLEMDLLKEQEKEIKEQLKIVAGMLD